jgi:hypothetical protein
MGSRVENNGQAQSSNDASHVEEQLHRIQTLSSIISRAALAAKLGTSYNGDRNLYQTLGYPTQLTYQDFVSRYLRQDIAKAIISRPVKMTWTGPLTVIESKEGSETTLERDWIDLERRLNLKTVFTRLDKLTGLGRYGILLMGFNDVGKTEDLANPVSLKKGLDILYARPLGEGSAKIISWDTNVRSIRYGMPELYDITLSSPDNSQSTIRVHHSRVLHIVEDSLESQVEGIPRLEVVYNRLCDLEKLVGGSSEMFWRGARPGYTGEVDKEFTMGVEQEKALQDQLDEYEHNLRRFLTTQGVSIKSLDMQISDPKNHVDVQMMMISAVTGIPKRILTGSERGELASTQDASEWTAFVQGRREEFAEPCILRPFINKMIEYKILPKPVEGYEIEWADLFSISEKDKAEIGRIRATSLREYFVNPLTTEVVPPKAFYELFLGFNRQQIELINAMEQDSVIEELKRIAEASDEDVPGLTRPIPNPTADKTENKGM